MEGMKHGNKTVKKQEVISTVSNVAEKKAIFDINEPISVAKLNEDEKLKYFERMVLNSRDTNLKLQIEKDRHVESGEWKADENAKELPEQKLPAAMKSERARRTEKHKIEAAKKVFAFADECTVRERDVLGKHYAAAAKNKESGIDGYDEAEDPQLTAYVNELLKFELSDKYLTDEYLSDHIAEMFDYQKRLSEYNNLKVKYPNFFSSLPEEKLMILEEKTSVANDLKSLLDKHIELHGIRIRYDDKNNPKVELIKDPGESEEERNKKVDEYNADHRKFYQNNILNLALITAKQYTTGKSFRSKTVLNNILSRISEKKEAIGGNAALMDSALSEVKNALAVRDSLVDSLAKELSFYNRLPAGADKEKCANRIKAKNAKIRVATAHIDHYRSFINYACGYIRDISPDTLAFLKAEEKEDILEAISQRRNALRQKFETAKEFIEKAEKEKSDVLKSREMQAFSMHMKNLLKYLGQKMPPLDFGKEAVDAGCIMATALYNNVINSINTCLGKPETYNNSEDAEKQLKYSRDLCKEESELFRDKVLEYRRMLESDSGKKKDGDEGMSWYDAISYQRASVLNLDGKDGVKMEKTGDQISSIYKLTSKTDGKAETVYFMKEERLAVEDDATATRNFFKDLDVSEGDRKILKPIFRALENDARTHNKKTFLAMVNNMHDRLDNKTMVANALAVSDWEASKAILDAESSSSMTRADIGKYLAEFAKMIIQREVGKGSKIAPGANLSGRNVATTRMAHFLGLNMIADSKTCYVRKQNSFIKGNLMEDTKGKTDSAIEDEANESNMEVVYSTNAINQLFSLQMFDIICGQSDRHHNNFHLLTNLQNGRRVITGVKGFDNDLSFGQMMFDDIKKGKFSKMRAVSAENLKGMPINMINLVMNLKREALDYIFCDILGQRELDALWNRVQGMQSSIRGLKDIRHDRYGRWYFEGEDGDDTIRQIKQLKKLRDKHKNISDKTLFTGSFCDGNKLDELLTQRKKELGLIREH